MTSRSITAIGVLAVCLAPTARASEPSAKINWAKAAEAPGYAKASASDPHFEDRAVWPLSGKELFLKQSWAKGRLLVWARPGESADVKNRRATLSAYDLKNWIDAATGQPPRTGPDADTDILLPASDTPYTVSWKKDEVEHFPVTVRHLTVERNARWYSSGLKAHGNIWLKRGGGMGNHGSLEPRGEGHAFFRNDNGDPSAAERTEGSSVSQYIQFNKKAGVSCEFFGAFSTGDEFRVLSGTLIIGPDSRVQPGRNATPYIAAEGRLVLLDGAVLAKWCNQISIVDLRVLGTLQGGLAERPLTRDAFVGISYQNTNGTKFYGNGLLSPPRNRSLEDRLVPLMVLEGAHVKTVSTDVEKACLVIGWNGLDAKGWHADGLAFRRSDPKAQDYLKQQLDKLPKGVTAAFDAGAEVDGVRFDYFLRGGILTADPAARRSWKHVFFGQHNKAAPEELFRKVSKINWKQGTYEL